MVRSFIMYLIMGSKEDPAASCMINELIKLAHFKQIDSKQIDEDKTYTNCYIHKTLPIHLKQVEGSLIRGEEIDKEKKYSCVVFLSKHESKLQNKTFCVHSPGNFGEAFGGEKRKLCRSSPWLFKNLMKELVRLNSIDSINKTNNPINNLTINPINNLTNNLINNKSNDIDAINHELGYEVWNEPTHHGPFCDTPCVFLEIGATKETWYDKNAAKIAANAIINILKLSFKYNENNNENTCGEKCSEYNGEYKNNEYKNAIYLGGLHYSDKVRRIILESEYAIGHICPKYSLELLDCDMLNQMIDQTGDVKKIFVEKKTFISGEKKQELFDLLEKTGIAVEKV